MGSSFLPSVMANQWKPFVATGLVRVVRIALVRGTWIRGSNPGGMGTSKRAVAGIEKRDDSAWTGTATV